jgi:hypothetical protein
MRISEQVLLNVKKGLVNCLALFLLVLSVEEGEDAAHYFPPVDMEWSEVDFDYLDFPTSVKRSVQELKTERQPQLPFFVIFFDQGIGLSGLDTVVNEKFVILGQQVLEFLLEVVICANAP